MLRLDHVGLCVPDLNAAVAWYVEHFKFRVRSTEVVPAHGVILDSGSAYLRLYEAADQSEHVQRNTGHSGTGCVSLIVNDLEAEIDRLAAAGVEFHLPALRGETGDPARLRWADGRDPWGNSIQLRQYPPLPANDHAMRTDEAPKQCGTQPERTQALMRRAGRVVPGAVHSGRRHLDPPFCVRRAYGAYIENLEGRRYIDYHAGFGAVVLGHADADVNAQVAEAAARGTLFGVGTTEDEVRLAEKIVSYVPSIEQVLFCNSGSEATLHAIRLARAATGRQLILKFQGHYHGFHDFVLRNCDSTAQNIGRRDPHSRGMLDAAVDATLVCRYNDLEDVKAALSDHPDQVAAIIVEPIAHNGPGIPPAPGFLEGLRDLANQHGCVLIFDEVISGFRHHLGGYQAIACVTPDLTTLGKAIANGYPFAALGGRRALMERFNTRSGGDVIHAGTYNANGPGVAAALATIARLEDGSAYEHLNRLGAEMRQGLLRIGADLDIETTVCGHGSLFALCFMRGPVTSHDDVVRNDDAALVTYRRELMRRGVFQFPHPGGLRCHISASHSLADIHRTLELSAEALAAMTRCRPALQPSDT
ncbi:aminotransferase class III-fold pyridoxal phosphate-dependent enzyme [Streptomyces sp. NPDC015346]|uniref:aminotransferase class III-fold pyridoxal phosphate-dependent enzyme n=1 Tax=Streptomyces sp. NPDC015346 TaxID=3364954 RepID=UPI0036F5F61F